MGFVWVHADSFLRCVASPFHSFVTTLDKCTHYVYWRSPNLFCNYYWRSPHHTVFSDPITKTEIMVHLSSHGRTSLYDIPQVKASRARRCGTAQRATSFAGFLENYNELVRIREGECKALSLKGLTAWGSLFSRTANTHCNKSRQVAAHARVPVACV